MRFMHGNAFANPWGILHSVRPVKRVADMLRGGLDEQEIYRRLREEFGVSDSKIMLALSIAGQELKLTKTLTPRDAAVYIDIPFCPTKCAYCSFASMSAEKMPQFIEPYLSSLYKDIETLGRVVKDLGFTVRSIYIGGGTPTTLLAIELDNLLYKLQQAFDFDSLWECTVEAGRPDTITEAKLKVMKECSVTRISINPQSMQDKTLQRIGRRHSAQAVFDAVALAKQFDFPAMNMDVIAGLPGETEEDFEKTLQTVEAFAPENITVHTMSIKRASRLREEAFAPGTAEHAAAQNMLDFAYSYLDEKGYFGYYLYRQKNTLGNLENTGFSQPDKACFYNIGMMEELMPVFGAGVGAVTKLVRPGRIERIFNVKDVAEYIRRIDEMCLRKQYAYEFYQGREN